MKSSVEDISPVKKRLSIEIESQEVDKKIDETYRSLAKRAKVPGFRPGKVPRQILEQKFAGQVFDDVTKDLINETFPQAMREAETFPIGTPMLEPEPLKQGENFKYSAVMEVRPKFELKNYLGMKEVKEKCSVTEKDVQSQLQQIRETHGSLTALEKDRPVREGDYIVLEYEGFENGQAIEGIASSNLLLKVGSNDFHKKVEEALIGLKKGDQKDIEIDFKKNYHHSKLAGKHVVFKVKIIDIKKMELPELNDEFAKGLSADFKDIQDLRGKIRESIVAQKEKEIDQALKQRLLQKISDGVEFELPQVLVESELNYAIESIRQNLIRSGSNLEKAGLTLEKLRKDLRPASEKRVKEMLILDEIARIENIEVAERDLHEAFQKLGSTMGQSPEAVKQYYNEHNLTDTMRGQLLEEKTLNYLVEHANISEKTGNKQPQKKV